VIFRSTASTLLTTGRMKQFTAPTSHSTDKHTDILHTEAS